MCALELVEDRKSKLPATELAKTTVARALERGLILLTCGLHGNVVRVLVPLRHRRSDLARGLEILEEALSAQAAEELPASTLHAAGSPADIELRGLAKSYADVRAVDHIELAVERGEFFTMLGPSGLGKTTTPRLIAGFERPDEGRVVLAGRDVTEQPPYARDVNTVFQDYALFPHMTVDENVSYGLRSNAPRASARA